MEKIILDTRKSTNKKEWDKAKVILQQLNEGKNEDYVPIWNFDACFKLDYDGDIVSVSSRFYPPIENHSKFWDGTVSILILSKSFVEKRFKADTIYELQPLVEAYVNEMIDKIKTLLINNIPNTYGSKDNIHQ